MGYNNKDSVILIGGVNNGQSTLNVIKENPSITIHGFEIQPEQFKTAVHNVRNYDSVHIHNLGWDEKPRKNVHIGGKDGKAGLYDPNGQRGWKLSENTVSTVRMDEWADTQNIMETTYILIDAEGFEPKIVRGMGIEQIQNRRRFPLIQYELGGTWAAKDKRHGNDKWNQCDIARWFIKNGYQLFYVGKTHWLPITDTFFNVPNNPLINDEGYGPYVQGNILAMHLSFTPANIQSFIRNVKPLKTSELNVPPFAELVVAKVFI